MSEPTNGSPRPAVVVMTMIWRGAATVLLAATVYFLDRLVKQQDTTANGVNALARDVSVFMGRTEATTQEHTRRLNRLEERVFIRSP